MQALVAAARQRGAGPARQPASPAQSARALGLIAADQVAVAGLITRRFPLAGIHAALDVLRQGRAIREP